MRGLRLIERLQRAFEHVDELPPAIQEELAEYSEQNAEPLNVPAGNLAGSMPYLPDDMEDTLFRMRHEVPPTPPMDERLRWLEQE